MLKLKILQLQFPEKRYCMEKRTQIFKMDFCVKIACGSKVL